jgi:hypothetical protein
MRFLLSQRRDYPGSIGAADLEDLLNSGSPFISYIWEDLVKHIVQVLTLLTVLTFVSAEATAASLNIVGGIANVAPSGVAPDDFIGSGNLFPALPTIMGFYGSTITYNVSGAGSVSIDFFGGEAGFHDQFLYNTGSGFVMPPGFDHTAPPSRIIAASLAAPLASFAAPLSGVGILPFEFMINGLIGGATGGPINGADPNNTPGTPPNFFSVCAPLTSTPNPPSSCSTLWVFLDDNGASDDNDFDDFGVRITVTDGPPTVPEPSPVVLLSGGLLGLCVVARKFRK